jgi:hypothetical protein
MPGASRNTNAHIRRQILRSIPYRWLCLDVIDRQEGAPALFTPSEIEAARPERIERPTLLLVITMYAGLATLMSFFYLPPWRLVVPVAACVIALDQRRLLRFGLDVPERVRLLSSQSSPSGKQPVGEAETSSHQRGVRR